MSTNQRIAQSGLACGADYLSRMLQNYFTYKPSGILYYKSSTEINPLNNVNMLRKIDIWK